MPSKPSCSASVYWWLSVNSGKWYDISGIMLNKFNTATLVSFTHFRRDIYCHFSRVMISAAVFTAAIDLAFSNSSVLRVVQNAAQSRR